ncbi:hypothetical protein RUM44_008595 [Polyplax serrata]|uniref:Uncharacterized protein n=1 Tax=Polyplax serrata TaxID=468196 RepID=A0ABR1BCQ7_POLSC
MPQAYANGDLDQEVPPANYERRRSRAVLYQLSGHYKQDKIKTKLKLNNTLLQPTNAPLPEYKTSAIKKSRFILSHYGVFKTCWDWLMLIATFYVAIVVPYNASFVTSERPSMVGDIVVETLFIIGKRRDETNVSHLKRRKEEFEEEKEQQQRQQFLVKRKLNFATVKKKSVEILINIIIHEYYRSCRVGKLIRGDVNAALINRRMEEENYCS